MGARLSYPTVDLAGKVALVTGGNTGIGYETAKALAALGAHTFIACRNMDKAAAALQRMKDEVEAEGLGKEITVEAMQLDLCSFHSTRSFVDAFRAKNLPLHLLINNAGIAWLKDLTLTGDNHETVCQVNHLSPLLLTLELLPIIISTASSGADCRIVFVSSLAHTQGVWNPQNMNGEVSYGTMTFYSNSKLYNVMTAFSLQRRLKGTGITVSSLHPGVISSELYRHVDERPVIGLFTKLGKLGMRGVRDGAATTINCAVNPELNSQQCYYYADCKPTLPTRTASNEQYQEQLWDISLQAVRDFMSEEVRGKYGASQSGASDQSGEADQSEAQSGEADQSEGQSGEADQSEGQSGEADQSEGQSGGVDQPEDQSADKTSQ